MLHLVSSAHFIGMDVGPTGSVSSDRPVDRPLKFARVSEKSLPFFKYLLKCDDAPRHRTTRAASRRARGDAVGVIEIGGVVDEPVASARRDLSTSEALSAFSNRQFH